MKYYLLALLLVSSSLYAADVPCDERARHGRVGAGKTLLAVACCIGSYYLIGELWDESHPLRTDAITPYVPYDLRKSRAWKRTYGNTIALAALVYATYKLSSEGLESLNIFLDDDDEELEQESTSEQSLQGENSSEASE